MCDGVVVKLPDGESICIPFYVEVDLDRPRPDPWRGIFLDLGLLRSVNRAITGLSDRRVSAQLSEAINQAALHLAGHFPDGITLGDAFIDTPRAATATAT